MSAPSCPVESVESSPKRPKQEANPLLDPSTFVPISNPAPGIVIEFCDRCRWLNRATWTATELCISFPPPTLKAVTVVPLNSDDTSGRFRVWLNMQSNPATGSASVLLWDRKVEGGFPELKVLKQRLRDHIQPKRSLGHSDNKGGGAAAEETIV